MVSNGVGEALVDRLIPVEVVRTVADEIGKAVTERPEDPVAESVVVRVDGLVAEVDPAQCVCILLGWDTDAVMLVSDLEVGIAVTPGDPGAAGFLDDWVKSSGQAAGWFVDRNRSVTIVIAIRATGVLVGVAIRLTI